MSDSEDGFDKEAEKERLREQLRKDERKRRETQRMSDLLLRGATMTNQHCDVCGDPIFRYDGQAFCPSCQGAAEDEAAAAASDHPADDEDMVAPGGEGAEGRGDKSGRTDESSRDSDDDRTDGTTDRSVPEGFLAPDAPDIPSVEEHLDDETNAAIDETRVADGEANVTDDETNVTDDETRVADDETNVAGGDSLRTPAGSQKVPSTARGAVTGSDTVTSDPPSDRVAARQALERTIVALANRAETADDPRQARELLAAAREAAETLAALDGSH